MEKTLSARGLASFLIFTILALISLAVNHVFLIVKCIDFMVIIWLSNIIAVIGIVILSYGISIITFRRGLNPENFVIPIETSFATIITSTALLIAITF